MTQGKFHMFFDKEGNPIEFMKLAELSELPDYRYIGRTDFEDGSYLSTIWTGMQLHETHKLIFETMFFPINGSPETVGRWETEAEAIEQHQKAKERLESQKANIKQIPGIPD